ncbi:MAG: hypothetical protein GX091_05130 [Peptococcaceae bacterium]|nr:hypothetical protein [Peptococcaceae bacterium]
MNNEKEILLDSEEIQLLLEGGLYWKDIEPKLGSPNSATFRRRLPVTDEESNNQDPKRKDFIKRTSLNLEKSDEQDAREIVNKLMDDKLMDGKLMDGGDDKKVRAILLGDNNIIKDRQIDLSQIRELAATSENGVMPESKTTEDKENLETPKEKKDFSLEDTENVVLFSNEIEDQEKAEPFISGWKLVLLMIVVAALTFGFWFYFLGQ